MLQSRIRTSLISRQSPRLRVATTFSTLCPGCGPSSNKASLMVALSVPNATPTSASMRGRACSARVVTGSCLPLVWQKLGLTRPNCDDLRIRKVSVSDYRPQRRQTCQANFGRRTSDGDLNCSSNLDGSQPVDAFGLLFRLCLLWSRVLAIGFCYKKPVSFVNTPLVPTYLSRHANDWLNRYKGAYASP